MTIKAIKTNIFCSGDNLFHFIDRYSSFITEGAILVVTSKILALSENRFVDNISPKDKEKIIKLESDFVLKAKNVYLTIKDGSVMLSAGVDESNANGGLILLPRDVWSSAVKIRRYLMKKLALKKLGVIISDSRSTPLRSGASGRAMAHAGFRGLKNYRGRKDIFGRKFLYSRVNVADSLAAAAVLCMGEGRERCPLAVIKEAPVDFILKFKKENLDISPQDDVYAPIFRLKKNLNIF